MDWVLVMVNLHKGGSERQARFLLSYLYALKNMHGDEATPSL